VYRRELGILRLGGPVRRVMLLAAGVVPLLVALLLMNGTSIIIRNKH
jgi:hypothetical protein